jgi:hypothetical protein
LYSYAALQDWRLLHQNPNLMIWWFMVARRAAL